MSKRVLAIILVIGGLISLAAIIWWAFFPRTEDADPLVTPRPVIDNAGRAIKPTEPAAPPISATDPAEIERQLQERLKRQGMSFAARYGTASNADGFDARSFGVDITAGLQPFLESERKKLLKAHPPADGPWGMTTRALSSRISSVLPIGSGKEAEVTVQTQQTTASSIAGFVVETTYSEIILNYTKVGDVWLVSRITSKPLAL